MIPQSLPLPRPAGFSLAASSRFAMNFPATRGGKRASTFNLAFALEDTWHPVGVHIHEGEDSLQADVVSNPGGADAPRIRENITRILNLHVINDPYSCIGRRDPIINHLQEQFSGLRPVQFPTPWEAAAWAVIGQRIRITNAAAIKRRLSERFGTLTVFPDGQALHSFPGPDAVLALPSMPGLNQRKFESLKAVAEAALDGTLSSTQLLRLEPGSALAQLQHIYGIGPFSAELILIRGAGTPDLFPTYEPRLARAMTALYGTGSPADHERIATLWKPYRSWVAFLIRQWLEAETREIATGTTEYQVPTPGFALKYQMRC